MASNQAKTSIPLPSLDKDSKRIHHDPQRPRHGQAIETQHARAFSPEAVDTIKVDINEFYAAKGGR